MHPSTSSNAGGVNPPHSRVLVAIPVRNEADRIGACLSDLIAQTHAPDAIVCLLNNYTDDTEGSATAVAATAPIAVHLVTLHRPPAQANVGHAAAWRCYTPRGWRALTRAADD